MQNQKSHEWRHHFWKQNKHTLLSLCWSISALKCLIIWSSVVYNGCGVPFEYCIGNTYNTFVLDFLCDILYGLLYTLSSHWLSSESTEYVYVRTDKIQISGRWFLSRWAGKTFFHRPTSVFVRTLNIQIQGGFFLNFQVTQANFIIMVWQHAHLHYTDSSSSCTSSNNGFEAGKEVQTTKSDLSPWKELVVIQHVDKYTCKFYGHRAEVPIWHEDHSSHTKGFIWTRSCGQGT